MLEQLGVSKAFNESLHVPSLRVELTDKGHKQVRGGASGALAGQRYAQTVGMTCMHVWQVLVATAPLSGTSLPNHYSDS